DGLNYLCPGFKRFFTYTKPYIEKMAAMSRSGAPAEQIRRMVRTEESKATGQTGRNAPCPCGSGKKYKKCCLGKLSFDSAGT
ncbi:MAG: SEC-C metal-binding domain-containing protein, partial [Rhodospirillales bacterium]|nr:SEC-C metal-binding domain-containing protein [Rhodospirillales bacterium]